MKKRLLSLALSAALLLALCLVALPAPAAAADDTAPEPPADLPDIDITSWEFKLCNAYNSVAWYTPEYGRIEGQGLDPRVVSAANALLADARAQGYTIYMAQAFRNIEWIETNYLRTFVHCGKDPILTAKTFPGIGVNEHQTGLAIDFTDERRNAANYDIFEDPEIFDSELYAWLLEHAPDYGFVLRYPEGKEEFYGVACPHAHFRYVGVEAARYMTEHDLCLEEFLMLYDPDAVYIPENGKLN
jgi:D-alanyl-D-alanine carboxypeptidase